MSNNSTPSSEKIKIAAETVLKLFTEGELQVAFDREIRYRLEAQFPHDITGEAIRKLKEDRKIKITNIPGRRGTGDMPNIFYCLPNSNYNSLIPLMHKKLDLSIFITGTSSAMGRHAELAWWRAFKRNNWNIYPTSESDLKGVNEYKGRKSTINNNIEYVAEKDGIEYGIEVKNGLNYPDDLYWKFTVATELETIPLIISRWLNPAQVPLIEGLGGTQIVYKDSIYSTTYKSMIEEARTILGTPVIAMDEIDDDYFNRKMQEVHSQVKTNQKEIMAKLKQFMLTSRTDLNVQRILGNKQG